MPRHARLMLAEVPVHVIHRGHNRGACFFQPADYRHYLEDLGSFAARFDCALHAYCLMTNHVHLLLTPATAQGCALLMKHLAQHHTQRVNRGYRRSGTLWEGRFRSCLTQSESYVLACYRYIELNPVRAGMVAEAGAYPWSSHRANADGEFDPAVTPHPTYLALGEPAAARFDAYQALCRAGLESDRVAEIRHATNGGFALGDHGFQAKIAGQLGRRVVRGRPGRPARPVESGSVPG